MNRFTFANVALVLASLVALTMSIVAIAMPYWEHINLGGEAERYYGLWKRCYSYRLYETCHQIEFVSNSMVLVRTLEIIGAILLFAALLCQVMAHCGMRHRQRAFFWDGLLVLLSGLVMLAGAIVFIYDTQNEYEVFEDITEHELHASFEICVIAGILASVAGILRLFLERGRRLSLQQNRLTQNQPTSMAVAFGNSGAPRIVLVPMSQHPSVNSRGHTCNATALALNPTSQMSQPQQPTPSSRNTTGNAAALAVYPSAQGNLENQNQTSRNSLPKPCPGSPISTSAPDTEGENYNTINRCSSTLEPMHGSDTNIEESPNMHSLPLCNQRMVANSGSTEEIWEPLNLTNY